MSDNRKYYYLKLKENYFDDDSIVLLESMQDGVLYSNILLKLYLKSLKHGGRLQLDEDIPYTAQMIATITRQQIGTVERALQIFLKLGLVEVLDSGTFYMSNIELLIGQSSTEAERKRAARLQNKALSALRTSGGHLSDIRPPEIEIELEKEMQQELKNTMNAMQPPQSIEEIKAGLETTEKGGVRQSIRNCLTVFQRDPLLSGAIAYNILTDRKDIINPIGFHRESTALNDTDMKYLLLYLEETYGLTNEKKIDNAIGIVANENKYHPIRDYLSALVWDGTERIRFCLRHFLGADADDYTYEALKLFLLGAISRAFQPGCKFEIMLCLVGGQGAGKSTFFRLLAVRDEWFSDDLRKLDDDNVYRKLQGHWIIEMSEMMATANAKSIEEIKSFLSRQKEVYKIPYETHPADRPRQCVFGGTSNALDFLPLDRSGNRRFIPVMVYPEQAEVHILEDEAASRAYIEQMWAEAMEIYRSGRFKLAFSPTMQQFLNAAFIV